MCEAFQNKDLSLLKHFSSILSGKLSVVLWKDQKQNEQLLNSDLQRYVFETDKSYARLLKTEMLNRLYKVNK